MDPYRSSVRTETDDETPDFRPSSWRLHVAMAIAVMIAVVSFFAVLLVGAFGSLALYALPTCGVVLALFFCGFVRATDPRWAMRHRADVERLADAWLRVRRP